MTIPDCEVVEIQIYLDVYGTCDIASLIDLESIRLKTIFMICGNKRDHTSVMDLLTSPYSDFIMNDREVVFHSIAGRSSGGV